MIWENFAITFQMEAIYKPKSISSLLEIIWEGERESN